ncbi:MAG TPA: tripartite tricarboxylate transporter substrate binding protein [Burkholderiaceae bacterium]|nr:tripartite tricarboxylate transporter substrate binding protein [Burkholderiaceae bacterium]
MPRRLAHRSFTGRLSRRQWLAASTAAWLAPRGALAQGEYPNRPIRLVVPYAPGGSADTLGRLIARHLGDALLQSVVVENRGGAGGLIGSQQVAKSAPDGYTLVVSGIGSHVIAPVDTPATFDPMRDFTHVALLGGPPLAMVVNASQPVTDVASFIRFVAARPAGLSWGSPGQGTHGHLTGELFRTATGLHMVHIGYKGAGPAVADLLANQIPAAFMTLSSANAHVDTGKLRLLAVSSPRRLAAYPNTPTLAELGYPQLTGTTWFSISGPAGMPAAVVDKLNTEIRRGLQTPAARQQMALESMETSDLDAAGFTRFVAAEIARWAPAVRSVSAASAPK